MSDKLSPGVKERVDRIIEVCDNELNVFLDNLDMVLRKKAPMTDWEREALKKSLVAVLDCSDTVLQEFK